MRVAVVCPYSMSRPGGVQGQVLGLARELRGLGVDARIIAPCDGPPPDPAMVSVGPTVEWESNGSVAPIATTPATARRTAEALRSIEPDVVHLHEPIVPGPCLSALLGFEGPIVGTFHSSGDAPLQWLRPAARSVAARLTLRVAVSDAARRTAEAHWGGDEYLVLWNGIEVERIAAVAPTPSDRPAVCFVGRHEPRKGLAVLLEAWAGLDRDAVCWVIGTGPQGDELRARGVPGVEWLGPVSERERDARLRGATVFCAPSLGGESFGIVLLEAMAADTAIVAAAIEGYSDVARADREARLVPPGDPVALRSALRELLDDADRRTALVTAGRARAEEFSMRSLAARYLECYERARVLAS
ncbi:MAG: glycosyltransferase family 4 protein [Actinomycetota bacterium]